MDLDEEVRVSVDGLGSRVKGANRGEGGIVVEYDYTTALAITVTVGVCLILVNLFVFWAIMCHRKRVAGGSLSVSSESPGSHRLGGTPLKSPYHNQVWKLVATKNYPSPEKAMRESLPSKNCIKE